MSFRANHAHSVDVLRGSRVLSSRVPHAWRICLQRWGMHTLLAANEAMGLRSLGLHSRIALPQAVQGISGYRERNRPEWRFSAASVISLESWERHLPCVSIASDASECGNCCEPLLASLSLMSLAYTEGSNTHCHHDSAFLRNT